MEMHRPTTVWLYFWWFKCLKMKYSDWLVMRLLRRCTLLHSYLDVLLIIGLERVKCLRLYWAFCAADNFRLILLILLGVLRLDEKSFSDRRQVFCLIHDTRIRLKSLINRRSVKDCYLLRQIAIKQLRRTVDCRSRAGGKTPPPYPPVGEASGMLRDLMLRMGRIFWARADAWRLFCKVTTKKRLPENWGPIVVVRRGPHLGLSRHCVDLHIPWRKIIKPLRVLHTERKGIGKGRWKWLGA